VEHASSNPRSSGDKGREARPSRTLGKEPLVEWGTALAEVKILALFSELVFQISSFSFASWGLYFRFLSTTGGNFPQS
jgi:hypothetical protein